MLTSKECINCIMLNAGVIGAFNVYPYPANIFVQKILTAYVQNALKITFILEVNNMKLDLASYCLLSCIFWL